MRLLIILCLFLGSCSVPYHLKQSEKHQFKAVAKGAKIERDTIVKTVTKSDTITKIDTVDNVVTITHTVRDTVFTEGQTKYVYKTRYETKQEAKTERKKAKFKNRYDKKKIKYETKYKIVEVKQQAKTERKESRSRWWVWLLVGLAVGFFVGTTFEK